MGRSCRLCYGLAVGAGEGKRKRERKRDAGVAGRRGVLGIWLDRRVWIEIGIGEEGEGMMGEVGWEFESCWANFGFETLVMCILGLYARLRRKGRGGVGLGTGKV